MKLFDSSRIRLAALSGLVVGALWLSPAMPLTAAEEAAKEEKEATETAEEGSVWDALEEFSQWVEVSAGGLTLDGDKASFQQRMQTKRGAFGGIQDFHYGRQVGEKHTVAIDGHAIFDNEDYKLKLAVTREGLGFLRGGFQHYRTWYDGSGGFFPPTSGWYGFYDEALALDRGELWVEGGLTLENWPTLTLKYSRQWREGMKDSTSWGYVHPYGAGPTRGLVPSFWDIDEHRHSFQGDLKHTIGKTTLGAGLRYDTSKYDNARKMRQYPLEAADRHLTHRETTWSDILNAHAFSETRFSKKVFFSAGYSFTTLDTDQAGSRIYGNDFDVGYVPILASDLGFYGLTGGSKLKEHTMNLNLMLTPWESLTLVPSFRLDNTGIDSWSGYIQTGLGPDAPMGASSGRDVLDLTEELELRYTGWSNWVFYARGEWNQGEGDLTEIGAAGIMPPINRYTEDSRWGQKYTAGVNWYPHRHAHLSLQYYRKMREYEYDHKLDSTPNDPTSFNRYPGFIANQDFDTDDVNGRLTLKPLRNLTLVSRYDFQLSKVHSLPDATALLGNVESARITSHIFSQNATWAPWSRLYLQAGFNYVLNKTETPADQYTQAVLDAKNNYWTLSFTSGFVLDDKTDLTASYYYYRADNYDDNSAFGVPYGAGAREHNVIAGITRSLRKNMRISLKYGFFTYRDQSLGGWNDFDAHMIYSSLHFRF